MIYAHMRERAAVAQMLQSFGRAYDAPEAAPLANPAARQGRTSQRSLTLVTPARDGGGTPLEKEGPAPRKRPDPRATGGYPDDCT